MNNLIKYLKIILTTILIILSIFFISKFGLSNFEFNVYLILFIFFIFYLIKDIIQKKENKKYNIATIIVLSIISFIFARSLFDKSFISNNSYYLDQLSKNLDSTMGTINLYEEIGKNYLINNCVYIWILLILILLYRNVIFNNRFENYKLCNKVILFSNLFLIIPTIDFYSHNKNWLLIIQLIFIPTEIFILKNIKSKKIITYINMVISYISLIIIICSVITNKS